MQTLTVGRQDLSTQTQCMDPAIGTCRLLLSDYERFSEVRFSDRATPRILQTISDEVNAYRINRVLFKECSAALFYSKPYLSWYAGVLRNVYSDCENLSLHTRNSELNRSFALRILSAKPDRGNSGVHLTLLLPPLWHAPGNSVGSVGSRDIHDSGDADTIGLCLLRPIGYGRWTGKLLQGEHEDGFRRLFSPEAV